MKSDKGMTVISLIVYIIVLAAVIGTVSMILKFFYRNMDETGASNNTKGQYSKFLAYIVEDVNSRKNGKGKLKCSRK